MNMDSLDKNNELSMVLKEVGKTIKIIGVDELVSILKTSRKVHQSITQEEIEKALNIINVTCEEFCLTLAEFYGTKRNNNRKFAMAVSANLIESFLNFDNAKISFILKKSEAVTSVYRNEILRLNENHISDSVILKKITNIKNKLKTTT